MFIKRSLLLLLLPVFITHLAISQLSIEYEGETLNGRTRYTYCSEDYVIVSAGCTSIIHDNEMNKLSELRFGGIARGVTISGSILLITVENSGLSIISIEDPLSPYEMAFIELEGNPYYVETYFGEAYVSAREGGIHVINLGIPEQPELLSTITEIEIAHDMILDGTLLYVIDRNWGLRVFDIGVEYHPEVYSYNLGQSWSIAKTEDYIITAGYGMDIFDVSDPTSISYVRHYENDPGWFWWIYAIEAYEDYVYVTHNFSFWDESAIIDLSDPFLPEIVGWFGMPANQKDCMHIGGGKFTYLDDYYRVYCHSLDNPISLPYIGHANPGYDIVDIEVVDAPNSDHAVISMFKAGVKSVNISDPENPYEADHYTGGWPIGGFMTCNNMAIDPDLDENGNMSAYVASDWGEPYHSIIGSIQISPTGIITQGDWGSWMNWGPMDIWAYDNGTVYGYDTMQNVQYSASFADVDFLSEIPISPTIRDADVKDGIMYAVRQDGKLWIVDVQDPYNNEILFYQDNEWELHSIRVNPPYLYLGVQSGLILYDVSNPEAPVFLDHFLSEAAATDVELWGDYVITASWAQGVRAFQVNDDETIQQVAHTPVIGNIPQIKVKGDQLIVGNIPRGLQIYSISNEDCLPGDFNSDQIVDILDVVSTVVCVLNEEDCLCADIDADGVVDILDIVAIVNIILES
ncbi:MAG: hypothetical protein ISR95_09235 [Candidatus Marinimicrobia bacterium]|nr:hypothetical protein [Candidatus Neomarinimicrobiota bacterium]